MTPDRSGANAAAEAALGEIDRLETVFNHRRADSEVARLKDGNARDASGELAAVIRLARHLREVTGGAFDERLGAADRLWDIAVIPVPMSNRQLSVEHRSF